MHVRLFLVSLVVLILAGCGPCEGEGAASPAPVQPEQREWAIAVHGGAADSTGLFDVRIWD